MKTTRPDELLADARARRAGLDPARRERLKRAVVAGVAASAGAAATASQAASLGGSWFGTVTAKVVLGLAAATVGSAATVGVLTASKRRAPVATPVVSAPTRALPSPAPVEAPAPAPPDVVAVPPVVEAPTSAAEPAVAPMAPVAPPSRITDVVSPAPAPIAPLTRVEDSATPDIEPSPVGKVAAARPIEPPAAPALTAQLAHLQQAMRFYESGDDPGALALLESWEKQFGYGTLHLEAKTLRLLVLCRLGRRDEAVALWAELERLAPGALKTPRLEQSCAAPEGRR